MLPAYAPLQGIATFAIVGTLLLLLVVFISYLVRPMPVRPRAEETYECGIPAQGEHRGIGFGFIGYAALFLALDAIALLLFLAILTPERSLATASWVGIIVVLTLVIIVYGVQKRRYYVT